MNILPKKSWHVRNKDNVARVRRDEEGAAEEARAAEEGVSRASREARTEFLRKRARLSLPDAPAAEVSPQSLNLFSDGEGGEGRMGGSKEYEEEKRQEKERRERSLGILTYLGQSVWESQTAGPWYARVPEHGTEAEAEKGRK
ncbi:leukocyte receptor cluster member 1 [Leucoraja erinacea]|uniref:leukocyte receptor cluster member 1 n=1 Tax=Leucoraja erinaceus TaxID=7782 RepID=UPI0024576436|nr:leukocyte receptor cluster member 1 [Leucoraja erinacea]